MLDRARERGQEFVGRELRCVQALQPTPLHGAARTPTPCTSNSSLSRDQQRVLSCAAVALLRCHLANVCHTWGPLVCSYKKLAQDVKPGSQILCADGSIVLVRWMAARRAALAGWTGGGRGEGGR